MVRAKEQAAVWELALEEGAGVQEAVAKVRDLVEEEAWAKACGNLSIS